MRHVSRERHGDIPQAMRLVANAGLVGAPLDHHHQHRIAFSNQAARQT